MGLVLNLSKEPWCGSRWPGPRAERSETASQSGSGVVFSSRFAGGDTRLRKFADATVSLMVKQTPPSHQMCLFNIEATMWTTPYVGIIRGKL